MTSAAALVTCALLLARVSSEVTWAPADGVPSDRELSVVGAIDVACNGDAVALDGWLVDAYSADRPDQVQVLDGDQVLAEVVSGEFVRRLDVEYRFGSSAYSLSGFHALIDEPPEVVTIRAHLMSEGWWQATVDLHCPD